MDRIDILFVAHNRIEFTRASFEALLKTCTPREHIVAFVDNDVQGTAAELRSMARPQDEVVEGRWGGPVAVTNAFLDRNPTRIFAKIDNDVIVCPHWLDICLASMCEQNKFDLVGITAMNGVAQLGGNKIVPAVHIGGIGVFRRRAFDKRKRPVANGRFGFTNWQTQYADVVKGWLVPPLPIFLLDRLPLEPWMTYSKEYRRLGWERVTDPPYLEEVQHLWSWWTP